MKMKYSALTKSITLHGGLVSRNGPRRNPAITSSTVKRSGRGMLV